MRWNPKDLERFVRSTSCLLTAREWETTCRNMKAFYASDGALPIDPRAHAWFGKVMPEKDWDDFVGVTNRERAAALPTSKPADPDLKRREYHKLYQRRRRWLLKHVKNDTVPDMADMPRGE